MRKDRLNGLLRAFARAHLSPTAEERQFVSSVYEAVCDVIGRANSLQIGSYPRFTAIRPLHDLDVLYILGRWDPQRHDPADALIQLEQRLRAEFENPTGYDVRIERQTHSVTLKFEKNGDEIFAVDVVPAYMNGRNDLGDDKYVVPEIATISHRERFNVGEAVSRGERAMRWIASDPRGYISVASKLNRVNDDFRKAVKLAKAWRASCKEADDDFPLKSFHLEQAITTWVLDHPGAEIFDMLFAFFCRLPDFVRYPQIPDRADPTGNIDAYVAELSEAERRKVIEARDGFLIKLENMAENDSVAALVAVAKRKRTSAAEAYLFDWRLPMLTVQNFTITAEVLPRTGGFRGYILDRLGLIEIDRQIRFRCGNDAPAADLFKWKVKNDDAAPQPRGEITDHMTLRDPEHSKYNGKHYVECFAIKDGVCIGRARQSVVLKSPWQS